MVEFLQSYGKVLGFEPAKDVPSLCALQEGLLGVGDSAGEVQDLLVRLLRAALYDPGLPPYCQVSRPRPPAPPSCAGGSEPTTLRLLRLQEGGAQIEEDQPPAPPPRTQPLAALGVLPRASCCGGPALPGALLGPFHPGFPVHGVLASPPSPGNPPLVPGGTP